MIATPVNGSKSDRKSTRLNSSHANISYAGFCLKNKKKNDLRVPFLRKTDNKTPLSGTPSHALRYRGYLPRRRFLCHIGTVRLICFFFFFNDTATTEIYTLSLHDALPIYGRAGVVRRRSDDHGAGAAR